MKIVMLQMSWNGVRDPWSEGSMDHTLGTTTLKNQCSPPVFISFISYSVW